MKTKELAENLLRSSFFERKRRVRTRHPGFWQKKDVDPENKGLMDFDLENKGVRRLILKTKELSKLVLKTKVSFDEKTTDVSLRSKMTSLGMASLNMTSLYEIKRDEAR